jgi:uncharacterized membrane protein
MSTRVLVLAALLPFIAACDRDLMEPERRAAADLAVAPQFTFATTSDYGPPVMLPTLDDHRETYPLDINAAGTILGYLHTWSSGGKTVFWKDGAIAELLPPAGWDIGGDERINAAGLIAATGRDVNWTEPDPPIRALLLRSGGVDVLEPLPGDDHSRATAINDHGWVAGMSWSNDYWNNAHRGVLWANGSATEIPLRRVTDMNNAGAVIGYSGEDWDAVIYRDGALTLITHPGDFLSQLSAVNDAGHVVVNGWQAGISAAYLWDNGATTPIYGPAGTEGWNVSVESINNSGVAVGQAWSGSQAVNFLWQNGSALALPELEGYGSWASHISDSGVIVGTVYTDYYTQTAAVWYPTRSHYAFGGFLRPVDNPPAVNSVKAGSAVPMKFSLGGDQGMAILAGMPQSIPVACNNGAQTGPAEAATPAGSSGLSYDPAAGTYTYVWKTAKSSAGTCRQFRLSLSDGSVHHAVFRFSR